jgi:heat shock protein HtpX
MNQLKTIALLSLLSALLFGISHWTIGGVAGAIVGLLLVGVTNFVVWRYADQIALSAHRAHPVSLNQMQRLKPLVEPLCTRAGIPLPALYIVPSAAANAFATGRDPDHSAIVLTEGLLRQLPDDELEGVIAHELSHIQHWDTLTQTVTATIAGAVSSVTRIAQYSVWFPGQTQQRNPLALLLTVIFAPLAALIIQLSIARSREMAADANAARLTGNPRSLANALRRLHISARQKPFVGNPAYAPLLIIDPGFNQFLSHLFSTHPPLDARLAQLVRLESEGRSAPPTSTPKLQPLRRYWVPIALSLLLGSVTVGAVHLQQEQAGLAGISVVQHRLTRSENGRETLTVIDPQETPQIFYSVKLDGAPLGQRLALTCDWVNPSHQVVRHNRYQTRRIDHAVWNTWCRYQFPADAAAGTWEVRMSLDDRLPFGIPMPWQSDRLLVTRSFAVRKSQP